MPSILDNAVLIGKESTYGTPATLTRAYEAKSDDFKLEAEYLESVGLRAGMHGLRSDRRQIVKMGASGTVELDWMTRGMGLILDGLLGTTSGPTQLSGAAYGQTHAANTDGPASSFTVQVQRVRNTGAIQAFTYHGCVPTSFALAQDVGGFLTLSIEFDAEDEDFSTAAGTPTYPASATPFNWTQAVVSINSVATDVMSFKMQADLGMKTDRRFLRGSALKRRPLRAAVPAFTGEFEVEFTDTTLYNLVTAGTIIPIEVTWTGAQIVTGHNYEVKVTIPAAQLEPGTPQASLDDLTKATVGFKALHNGSDPIVTISLKSEDTAL